MELSKEQQERNALYEAVADELKEKIIISDKHKQFDAHLFMGMVGDKESDIFVLNSKANIDTLTGLFSTALQQPDCPDAFHGAILHAAANLLAIISQQTPDNAPTFIGKALREWTDANYGKVTCNCAVCRKERDANLN